MMTSYFEFRRYLILLFWLVSLLALLLHVAIAVQKQYLRAHDYQIVLAVPLLSPANTRLKRIANIAILILDDIGDMPSCISAYKNFFDKVTIPTTAKK